MNVNLRLKDFNLHAGNCFTSLLDETDFADVTLVCDDNKQIKAHKVILGLGSDLFKNILQNNPHPHPLIYLENIQLSMLESALQFLYFGEVEVQQNAINEFLLMAGDLKMKGLTENKVAYDELEDIDITEDQDHIVGELGAPHSNENGSTDHQESDIDIDIGKKAKELLIDTSQTACENVNIVAQEKIPHIESDSRRSDIIHNPDDQVQKYSQTIPNKFHKSMLDLHRCEQCPYTSKWEGDLWRHHQSKHEPLKCDKCPKELTTVKGMKHHQSTVHEGLRFPCKFCPYKGTNIHFVRKHGEKYHENELLDSNNKL